MERTRLEAFSDAVIAIAMTVLVLETLPPTGDSFADLWEMRFKFIVYVISFITYLIYWKNHHRLFSGVRQISHKVLWLNGALLFFLSLFSFATSWMDLHISAVAPEVLYGVVMLGANLSFVLLAREIDQLNEGRTYARLDPFRVWFTIVLNVLGIGLTFLWPPTMVVVAGVLLVFWSFNYFTHAQRGTNS